MYTVLLTYLSPSLIHEITNFNRRLDRKGDRLLIHQVSSGKKGKKGTGPFFYYNDINHVLLDIPE